MEATMRVRVQVILKGVARPSGAREGVANAVSEAA
jgi:hypothetical protein